jgi:hypothetical protein
MKNDVLFYLYTPISSLEKPGAVNMTEKQTEVYLYRSVHEEQFPNGPMIDGKAVTGVLYPDFVDRKLKSGKIRKADVQLTSDNKSVLSKGGTSLFDRDKVFRGKSWFSFPIPNGTVVPSSLEVRHTGFNDSLEANHYQIECTSKRMPIESFKGALDNLARNAVVRFIELSKG